ncbi:DUF397 domain-containing protein [Nonomuraea turcica]|uniref:DUF397 domain-containing protein n=1 Tax=Nonomuraea sp. G32 TaxID=3067274 RepID=UPI00273BD25D|nr:DUF397 domain-containing protein [Nonomuraea sp. G32]MDP4505512.1 DUF397 domain-containing protein [Nonomuraea sp. G32]
MISASGLHWTKSSYSTNGGDCVEVAVTTAGVHVRDSKDPDGPVLTFTPSEFRALVAGAKDGEFDGLAHQAE